MRILHIYKDYYPVLGGIENHVRALAEAQAGRGHQVTVLVTGRGRRTERGTLKGVSLIKAGRLATVASAPLSLALPLELRRLRPDVAHVHVPYPVGEVANWLLGHARSTVLTYHSDVVRQRGWLRLYAPLLRRVLAAADRILVSSPRYLASSPFLQPVADKCRVVPYGLQVERYLTADPRRVAGLRRQLGRPLILFVGRLRYYKGLQYLLQALASLPEAHLAVVGTGPMERRWRALAVELRLGERVCFCGEVADDDLPAYYHAADLFVLPSCERSEAFGLVQVEAMAAGLPVVCTELGTGTSFVNLHGETGLVVPPRDPGALAEACAALLADSDRRRFLGDKGRQRALAEFTLQRMVERVEAVYAEAMGEA
ncbi:MAG: glycosyltransferase [Anaerolineae bacterium]|nr:glycosyltransferase [Anaerolineae bacterium]